MKENLIQINGGIMINVDVSVNSVMCEKKNVWNPATCICKNGKYLASIVDDSAIICVEVIESRDEEMKTIPTNFNEKKATCNAKKLSFTFIFINYYGIIDSCLHLL